MLRNFLEGVATELEKRVMPKQTKLICDKCKKEIKEGYQLRYMITLTVGYPLQYNDGGSCPAVDRESEKVK